MVRALAGDSTMTSRVPSPAWPAAPRPVLRPGPDDDRVLAAVFLAPAADFAGRPPDAAAGPAAAGLAVADPAVAMPPPADSFVAAMSLAAAPFLAGTLFPNLASTAGAARMGPVLGTLHGVARDAHPRRSLFQPTIRLQVFPAPAGRGLKVSLPSCARPWGGADLAPGSVRNPRQADRTGFLLDAD
jgi:hypothetical protein